MVKIKRFSSFYSVFYFVKYKEKKFLIDCGSPFDFSLVKEIDSDLDFLLITHGHWDHIGNVGYLAEKGIKVFIHDNDYEIIKNKIVDLPPPKGSLYSEITYLTFKFFKKFARIEKFEKSEIEFKDKEFEMIYTPGHTLGSVTFRFKDNFFIGDTLIGPNPFLKRPRISLFVRDKNLLKKTLEHLFELEGKFFPGHGKPFSSELLRKTRDFLWKELKIR